MIGPISPDVKQMGARSAGNPHAACDVEGAGNVARSGCLGRLARQSSTLPGKPFFVPALRDDKLRWAFYIASGSGGCLSVC